MLQVPHPQPLRPPTHLLDHRAASLCGFVFQLFSPHVRLQPVLQHPRSVAHEFESARDGSTLNWTINIDIDGTSYCFTVPLQVPPPPLASAPTPAFNTCHVHQSNERIRRRRRWPTASCLRMQCGTSAGQRRSLACPAFVPSHTRPSSSASSSSSSPCSHLLADSHVREIKRVPALPFHRVCIARWALKHCVQAEANLALESDLRLCHKVILGGLGSRCHLRVVSRQ